MEIPFSPIPEFPLYKYNTGWNGVWKNLSLATWLRRWWCLHLNQVIFRATCFLQRPSLFNAHHKAFFPKLRPPLTKTTPHRNDVDESASTFENIDRVCAPAEIE
ncbi:Aminoglycoside phosphotransferase [Sesbania bispinosa]|nr:Aminoglycoside phosphotransferase [Sesbania bispinosa]